MTWPVGTRLRHSIHGECTAVDGELRHEGLPYASLLVRFDSGRGGVSYRAWLSRLSPIDPLAPRPIKRYGPYRPIVRKLPQ
jgi:hypothetical protein